MHPSNEGRKSLRAQSDPIGSFLRGDTLSLLQRRRVRMHNATRPTRMYMTGCRTMTAGSGRAFSRECLACRGTPCSSDVWTTVTLDFVDRR